MSQSIDEVLLGTPARAAAAAAAGGGDPEQGEQEQEGEGDKFVRQLFESLLLGTRASNAIPDGEGQEVCRSSCLAVPIALVLVSFFAFSCLMIWFVRFSRDPLGLGWDRSWLLDVVGGCDAVPSACFCVCVWFWFSLLVCGLAGICWGLAGAWGGCWPFRWLLLWRGAVPSACFFSSLFLAWWFGLAQNCRGLVGTWSLSVVVVVAGTMRKNETLRIHRNSVSSNDIGVVRILVANARAFVCCCCIYVCTPKVYPLFSLLHHSMILILFDSILFLSFLFCTMLFYFSPQRQDYAYNATFPEFRSRAEGCGKQVLEVIQIFLNHVRQEGELGLPDVGDAGDPEIFQVC